MIDDLRASFGDVHEGPPLPPDAPSLSEKSATHRQQAQSLLLQITKLAREVDRLVAQSSGVRGLARGLHGGALRLICTPTRVVACGPAQPVTTPNKPSRMKEGKLH